MNALHMLLNLVWTTADIPVDRKKGLLVNLLKRAEPDILQCSVWRGTTLLSSPSKVLTIVILEQMIYAIDQTLDMSRQGSGRKDKSRTHNHRAADN